MHRRHLVAITSNHAPKKVDRKETVRRSVGIIGAIHTGPTTAQGCADQTLPTSPLTARLVVQTYPR